MKAHLISSEEPLTAGSPLKTACGGDVKKAYFPMAIDQSGVTGRTISALISANTLLLCQKCQKSPLPGNYVYLVTESTDKLEAADAAIEA